MLTRRSFLGAVPALYGVASFETLQDRIMMRAREYHVAKNGKDENDGTASRPLLTISAAAARAFAGDVITVHEGVYRERINPPRGGTSDKRRIVYRAAPGERVEITGAEKVGDWVQQQRGLWKTTIPNSFFGKFNPYSDLIHGDWFDAKGRTHHTGAVYLNGEWLAEAAKLDDLFTKTEGPPLWFGQVDTGVTTLWAQFRDINPNEQQTEINVRQTVFYPEETGIDYITVRGFILRCAATPWAPPTAQQIGLIGPNWSKGWIIENNSVSYSTCCGISLGKYGDSWDNTSKDTAEGYVKTIERALEAGWSREKIGHHIVRNNSVSHCEQAGIVGSLGGAFSTITGNTIHDIYIRRLFSGWEMAGIKLHGAIDVEISHNRFYRNWQGIWLDWMAQGTRVSGNLFYENDSLDLFVEVDHGPFAVDNNIFLSQRSQLINSQGGAYAHNLFCGGTTVIAFEERVTPFMKPHSTRIAGNNNNPSGDMRFYNNVFAEGGDLSSFNETRLPMQLGGNVFLKGTKPCSKESAPLLLPNFDPQIRLIEDKETVRLQIEINREWLQSHPKLVTTKLLGRTVISDLPFENADGTLLLIDRDYLDRKRDVSAPLPGPLEERRDGKISIQVWPVSVHKE
jgi:alpha-L-arabinofuranosidase